MTVQQLKIALTTVAVIGAVALAPAGEKPAAALKKVDQGALPANNWVEVANDKAVWPEATLISK
jgi:hypothetical protein